MILGMVRKWQDEGFGTMRKGQDEGFGIGFMRGFWHEIGMVRKWQDEGFVWRGFWQDEGFNLSMIQKRHDKGMVRIYMFFNNFLINLLNLFKYLLKLCL